MATKDDGKVLVAQVTQRESLALQLAAAMRGFADEMVSAGGYRPSARQWRALLDGLKMGACALADAIELPTSATDDQLDGAARDVTAQVLRQALGPAPAPVN